MDGNRVCRTCKARILRWRAADEKRSSFFHNVFRLCFPFYEDLLSKWQPARLKLSGSQSHVPWPAWQTRISKHACMDWKVISCSPYKSNRPETNTYLPVPEKPGGHPPCISGVGTGGMALEELLLLLQMKWNLSLQLSSFHFPEGYKSRHMMFLFQLSCGILILLLFEVAVFGRKYLLT